jgi:hypothetical protein
MEVKRHPSSSTYADKINIKSKSIEREKEGNYEMMKGINTARGNNKIYTPNTKNTYTYKATVNKGKTSSNTIIAGDISNPFFSNRQIIRQILTMKYQN